MERTVQTNDYGEIKLSNSEADIMDLIAKLRNNLIKDFLDERFLKEYFKTKYHIADLSNVKVEFIRKDLKELYLSPVDADHYKTFIAEIQANEITSLTEENESLFYKEIESIFQKYFY